MDDKTTKKVAAATVAGAVLAGTLSHKLEHLDPPLEAPILPNAVMEATLVSSSAQAIALEPLKAALQGINGKFKG